jgi:hypothetical protein
MLEVRQLEKLNMRMSESSTTVGLHKGVGREVERNKQMNHKAQDHPRNVAADSTRQQISYFYEKIR